MLAAYSSYTGLELHVALCNKAPLRLTSLRSTTHISPGCVLTVSLKASAIDSSMSPAQAKAADGRVVAVKALSLRRMTDWKQLELFEREAKVLETLTHPGIPKYVDYLTEDTEKDRGFFLVQVHSTHRHPHNF